MVPPRPGRDREYGGDPGARSDGPAATGPRGTRQVEESVWKVGELAGRTGLTVRTLHHYDAIGLLSPSRRTSAGYRLYEDADVARLQQVVALRQLGLTLEEIRVALEDPSYTLPRVLRLRAGRMKEEIEAQRRLCARLETLAERLDATETVSVEEWLEVIGAMTMVEKYYTPEQLAALEKRREEVGEARIREVQEEWPTLIAAVRAEMEKGTEPTDPRVRELARRWMGLVAEFTGGDPGIAKAVKEAYTNEPAMRERSGIDPAMFDYVRRASATG